MGQIRTGLYALLLVILLMLAGCHEGQWHWITPEPQGESPAMVTVEPVVVPEEEEGETEPEPALPAPCAEIKGNISRDGRKLYHEQGMRNYGQVKIDEEAGERWFCSPEEAEEAGWTRAGG